MAKFINTQILSNDPKIKSICSRYWSINSEGEFSEANTKQICQDFDLTNYKLTKIIQEYSTVTSETYKCDGCNKPWEVTSRTQYLDSVKNRARLRYRNNICDSCKEKERLQAIEQAKLEKIEAEKRMLLARDELISINGERPPFCLEDLEFKELVFLKTLLDHSGSETLESINPYNENPGIRVAPGDIPGEIISDLKSKNIILVDPESEGGTYFLDEDDQITYYPASVNYKINFDIDLYTKGSGFYKKISDLLSSPDFFKEFQDEFIQLSQQIMVQSLLEFMQWMIDEHNLVFSPGEKTMIVLHELTEEFSISQGMNIIYGAVKSAAAYAMKDNISRNQAANSVIGTIQRRIEKIRQENWDTKKFGRNYDLPQSIIERVLYSKIVNGDDAAFDLSLKEQLQILNDVN